jgi:hypothetical protein
MYTIDRKEKNHSSMITFPFHVSFIESDDETD